MYFKQLMIIVAVMMIITVQGTVDAGKDDAEVGTGAGIATFLDTLNKGKELTLGKQGPVKQNTDSVVRLPEVVKTAEKKETSEGFRIQIIASSSETLIREKKQTVEKKLRTEANIEFDNPYYKLYVGKYSDRSSAEKALVTIRQSGYTDAWIVKSKVFIDQ